MKVVAIDCSAKAVSVALADNGKLIAEGFLNIKLTHSETLMPMVEQILTNSKITLNDIDAFAVTAGPGSFTGVRIGISALKGMAFNDEKPVYPFSTLMAMPLVLDKSYSGVVCALMDARRNQFYNAVFEIKNGEIIRLTEDRLISAEELLNELTALNNKVLLMGDGAELFYTLSNEHSALTLAPETVRLQRASGIAVAASSGKNSPEAVTPTELQTVYLRKSQAEREREEKLLKK